MTDWLLRGSHPIAFDVDRDQLEALAKEGVPVKEMGDEFPTCRPRCPPNPAWW